ncbi:MAG TPA: ABC transporter ATP-binding protein, partial [Syntrophorhabdaceae bacterium]|nr:ABC transporter ATP-binding protein [Syntrophorhabdaceae bacterium]
MDAAIKIDSLHFKYRSANKESLVNINLEVNKGNFVVILGHGGAGKSTLCFSINGLIPRFLPGIIKGNVLIKDKKTTDYPVNEMAKIVGLVFQDFEAQLFCSSVELEIAFGLENISLNIADMEERIKKYLDFVGLLEKRKAQISSLSGGQKQRLAIGAVLAMEPDVVVMDEPTTDLDPIGKNHVLSISDMIRDKKRTLIMVDNDYEVAVNADSVWLMKDGEVVAKDAPKRVLSNIDLLNSCGVMAPPTVELFRKMGWEEEPLTANEAVMYIKEKHPEIIIPERTLKINKKPVSFEGGIIETKGLFYRYPSGQKDVLKNINLKINGGEFVAILGQNGSGKTTLARHFNRLLTPTSGEVLVKGKKTTDYKQHELAR